MLISVIVPVYNIERYIGKCVESLIHQTYKKLEILLIDDGSTDGSGNICDKYMEKDKRIKVIHKPNGGLSDARNRGLDSIQGDGVMFIDGDDYLDINMIQEMVNVWCKTNADLCVSNIFRVDENGNLTKMHNNKYKNQAVINNFEAMRLLATEVRISTSACDKLYKVELFREIRFPVGKAHEDQFTMYKIFAKVHSVAFAKRANYYYLYRSGSITNCGFIPERMDDIEACEERLIFFKRHYPKLVRYARGHLFHRAVWTGYLAFESNYKSKKIENKLDKICHDNMLIYIFCPDYSLYVKMNTLYRLLKMKIYR